MTEPDGRDMMTLVVVESTTTAKGLLSTTVYAPYPTLGIVMLWILGLSFVMGRDK